MTGILIDELKQPPETILDSFSLRTAMEYIDWLRGYRTRQTEHIQTAADAPTPSAPVQNAQSKEMAKDAIKSHVPSIEIPVDLETLRKRAKTESWRFAAKRKQQI